MWINNSSRSRCLTSKKTKQRNISCCLRFVKSASKVKRKMYRVEKFCFRSWISTCVRLISYGTWVKSTNQYLRNEVQFLECFHPICGADKEKCSLCLFYDAVEHHPQFDELPAPFPVVFWGLFGKNTSHVVLCYSLASRTITGSVSFTYFLSFNEVALSFIFIPLSSRSSAHPCLRQPTDWSEML